MQSENPIKMQGAMFRKLLETGWSRTTKDMTLEYMKNFDDLEEGEKQAKMLLEMMNESSSEEEFVAGLEAMLPKASSMPSRNAT